MLKSNEKIEFSESEALSILCDLEYLLISLRNIGAYYHEPGREFDDRNLECRAETTKFIDENKVTKKIAKLRKMISESSTPRWVMVIWTTLRGRWRRLRFGKTLGASVGVTLLRSFE